MKHIILSEKYPLWLPVFGILIITGVLLLEFFTRFSGTVIYIAVIAYTLWFIRFREDGFNKFRKNAIILGVIASTFLVGGLFYAINNFPESFKTTFIINRLVAILAIWLSVYFTIRYRKTQADKARVREQLNALFEAAKEGIIIVDDHHRIKLINPYALDLFAYKNGDLTNQSLDTIIPNYQLEELIVMSEKTNFRLQHNFDWDLFGKRNDGKEFPISTSTAQFRTEQGLFFVVFINDITDQIKSFRQIRQLNETLERNVSARTEELKHMIIHVEKINTSLQKEIKDRKVAEERLKKTLLKERELGELKSRFVTLASHEFRSPLTTIQSSSFLLENFTGQQYEKGKAIHLGRIKRSVNSMTEILNDFLSLGKLDEGKVVTLLKPIVWSDFLLEVVNDVQSLKQKHQILETFHKGEDFITSDRKILKSIVTNLISNAFKYTDEDDRIIVNTSVIDNILSIKVSDHGIGIPYDEQKYIFTRFFRARNASNTKGTGLGLNIVKRYVELMKGSISFTSVMGSTTFIVALPLTKAENQKKYSYELNNPIN